MDFLKSAVASAISKGPLAGYVLAERVDIDNSIWSLNNATKREGNVKCSVFTFDVASNRSRVAIAKNAVRKSRTLHHPGSIRVVDTVETDSQIYLITERVTPLAWFTKRKSLSEEKMKWGLWGIAATIKFINEEAASVHGCVRTSSVFVSESGEWRLGGFEILSSMNDDEAVIYAYGNSVPDSGRYLTPEVSKAGWEAIKKNPLPATDAYGFGAMIYEIFNGTFSGHESATQAKGIPPSMQQNWKRLMNANPKVRLSVAHFLEQGRRSGGFFQTPMIGIAANIDNLGLKSEYERAEFLEQLNEVAQSFPEEYLTHKILPELVKSVEFGGGGPKVVSLILKIGTSLSEEEYEAQLTPALIRLFASPDRAIRVCLLDNLPAVIGHLSQKVVSDKVFPNLVTGFTDMAPVVREQTVRSVLVIIPKLPDRIINGELLKYLAKTANDEQPGIRTNTTICLGKMAKYLSNNTRTKVLVAAFTRSLRDPFVHARNAALQALAATADSFSDEDCAAKILPAVCPSLLDKEKIVRDQANTTLEIYMSKVRKCAANMPDSVLPDTSAAGENGGTVPAASEAGAGWMSFSIPGFTLKLGPISGTMQSKSQGYASNATLNGSASESRPGSSISGRPTTLTSTGRAGAPAITRNATETTKLAQSFDHPELTDSKDFWNDAHDETGEDEAGGWGAMDDDIEDEVETTANDDADEVVVSEMSQHVRPASRPAAASEDQGEPDFAGWLKAQSSSKAKKGPLPKGLGSSKVGNTALPRTSSATGRGGIVGSSSTAKKATMVAASKASIVKKEPEKQEEVDESWGDAWE